MVGQWIGRANVAAALFVMSAFGLHSARQCSVLINLVEHSHANPVSNQAGFVALAAEYEVATPKGRIVSVARFGEGQFGSVSFGSGRTGLDTDSNRRFVGSITDVGGADGGSDGSPRYLPTGTPF